jgi:hypothetical protein
MDVGPVVVISEICIEQAEAGDAWIAPVPGQVAALRAWHVAAILANTAFLTGMMMLAIILCGDSNDHSNVAWLGSEFDDCGSL